MTARKTTKRKPGKLKKAVATQTIADINALFRTQKKLDLELRKIERRIKKMMGHQYFA